MRSVRLEMEIRWASDLVEIVTETHCYCGASSAAKLLSVIMRPDGGAPLRIPSCCVKMDPDEFMLFLELCGASLLVRRIPRVRKSAAWGEYAERIKKGLGIT